MRECVLAYLPVCLHLCVCANWAIWAICASVCAGVNTQMDGQGVAGLRTEVFSKWNSYR